VREEMLSTRGDALFVEAPSTANRSQLVVNRAPTHVIPSTASARAHGASGRSLRDHSWRADARSGSDTLVQAAPDARSPVCILQNVAASTSENSGLFAESGEWRVASGRRS
jgi:hypothetical protein